MKGDFSMRRPYPKDYKRLNFSYYFFFLLLLDLPKLTSEILLTPPTHEITLEVIP